MIDRERSVFANLALSLLLCTVAAQAQVELVSRTAPGLISDTTGGQVTSISADGRYVVFQSFTENLVAGQQSTSHLDPSQVFLRDRVTGLNTLVSRASASPLTGGNGDSKEGIISADGRFVIYLSSASNLIAGLNDGNGSDDLFLYDRIAGTTTLVSRSITLPNRAGSNRTIDAVISADGRYVAFTSTAEDLAPEQGSSGSDFDTLDVFLYDRVSGVTSLLSRSQGAPVHPVGGSLPAISADGAWVAFLSPVLSPGFPSAYPQDDLFLYEVASGTLSLVSRRSDDPAQRQSASWFRPLLSADGRYLAFTSPGPRLVPGQGESESSQSDDAFVFDRVAGTMTLASRSHGSAVTPGNARSYARSLSADGRLVAVESWATDLVAGQVDTPSVDFFTGTGDVFVYDRALGTNLLVSRSSTDPQTTGNAGSYSPQLSADGSHVAFASQASNLVPGQTAGRYNVFLFELATGTQRWISRPAGGAVPAEERSSYSSFLNADASYVAFSSTTDDLVSGLHDPRGEEDAFLYSRATESSVLLSRRDPAAPALSPSASAHMPLVSADGRFVAYLSSASFTEEAIPGSHPAGIYLFDRVTGARTLASPTSYADFPSLLAISENGHFLTFQSSSSNLVPGQIDSDWGSPDIFSYDRITGTIALVSRTAASSVTGSTGCFAGRPTPDGRYVPLTCSADNMVAGQIDTGPTSNVFLHDRLTGTTELVSHASGSPTREANGHSSGGAVSPDGRYVAFSSQATDLVPGLNDPAPFDDLFLYDRRTGTTTLVSRSSQAPNTVANAQSGGAVFGGASCLAFTSAASNLLPVPQADFYSDVFVYSLVTGNLTLVSRAQGSASIGGNRDSFSPAPDAGCAAIAFTSYATNLLPGQQPDQTADLFLFEPALGITTLLGTSTVSSPTTSVLPPVAVMSEDGRFTAFPTRDDLVNGGADFPYENLYLFDRANRDVVLISRSLSSPATPANQKSTLPSLSANGRFVAFQSEASDLVAGDFNGRQDVFLFDNELAAGNDFHTLAPCRLVDTRRPEDGPALTSGTSVIFDLDGGCGIPATARALALNVTVFDPTGQGNLSLGPGDAAPSGTSTINFLPGVNKANNAIVRLSLDGSQSLGVRPLVVGGGTVHVILDVVGWFE